MTMSTILRRLAISALVALLATPASPVWATPMTVPESNGLTSGNTTSAAEPSRGEGPTLSPGTELAIRLDVAGSASALAATHDLRIVDTVGPASEIVLVETLRAVRRNDLRSDHRVSWLAAREEIGASSAANGVLWAWGLLWAWTDDAVGAADAVATSSWQPSAAPDAGDGVIIAVIDSGIDRSHWSFASTRMLPGYDFVDNDADPHDGANGVDDDDDGTVDEGSGHGTYVTSLITQGAPGATILPIRAIDDEGRTDTWTIARAVTFAVDQGADIVNLSLGSDHRD